MLICPCPYSFGPSQLCVTGAKLYTSINYCDGPYVLHVYANGSLYCAIIFAFRLVPPLH